MSIYEEMERKIVLVQARIKPCKKKTVAILIDYEIAGWGTDVPMPN